MKYFDAHCHIQFPQYDADREEVLKRMTDAGVGGIVVGCDAASSRAAAEFIQGKEGFLASVGQHPNDNHAEEYDEHLYRNLLMYPGVVAIGECGLDYYRPEDVTEEVKEKQKALFTRQVRLAGATRRALIVHARPSKGSMDAYHDALDIVEEAKKEFPNLKGDFHFFVGDIPTMERIVRNGFTVSYTAVITFARDYDEVIRAVPLESLLTETDAPYVAPGRIRGQRNEPTSVVDVVEKLAEIRGEDPETLREATLQNALKLFSSADF